MEPINLDPKDVNSDIYADRPLIAEDALALVVSDFCRARNFQAAASAIEIEVRRAYKVEGAA